MKSICSKFLATLSCVALSVTSAPLQVFASQSAFEENAAQLQSDEITFSQFSDMAYKMSCQYSNEDGFFGEIEIKEGESAVFINGEKTDIYNFAPSEFVNGELLADAKIFEIFDENAGIDITDQGVTVSTENGEVTVDSQSCSYSESVLVPIGDIALDIGYEVTQSYDSIVLSNPFESARLIVKSQSEIDRLNAVDAVCGFMGLSILQFETPLDAYNAYNIYSNSDNIEFVTPSQMRSIDVSQQAVSTYASSSQHNTWGADAMSTDSFNSILTEQGKNDDEIIVAVLDTGVDLDHDALADRILESGANFSASSVTCADDDQGHGTHVAGIICDLTLDNVKILPVKVLDSKGRGYDDMIFTGIIYAVESGADVINMSLGGFGHGDIYKEAIDYANANGVVICVAAGNDSVDTYRTVPANCDDIITISAIDEDLSFASYSNFGSEIEFSAPGTDVISTYIDNQYAYLSGTSMACPHASAAVAMLKSYDSTLGVDEITDILQSCAIDLGDKGYDECFGYGLISFDKMNILADKCASPIVSLAGGEYENNISITLSTDDENDEIYYTLDSSEPSAENGILYQGDIEISQSCILKAKAFCNGKYPSDTVCENYVISGADLESCFEVSSGVITNYSGILSEVVVPSQINGDQITAIGENAFSYNNTIESIILPQSVVSVENSAFEGCAKLESISAENVLSIGNFVFAECDALKNVDLNSLTQMGDAAFQGCDEFESIYLPNINALPQHAFAECKKLESVDAENVTSIGSFAFYECSALSSLDIDFENADTFSNYAFYMCTALESPFYLKNINSIGEYCFYGCKNIRYVILGNNITAIPAFAFAGCSNIDYLGAPDVNAVSENALCHMGDVFTDMDIENLEIGENALEGTTLAQYENKSAESFLSIEAEKTVICENAAALSFECTLSGVYYLEISAALLAHVEITSQSGEKVQLEVVLDENNEYICSLSLSAGEIYSINVASRTSKPFAVCLCGNIDDKTDISSFAAEYAQGTLTVTNGENTLSENTDYIYTVTDNGIVIFGTNDYCGTICLYQASSQIIKQGELYTLNSLYGADEFAFIPQKSQTYYFYALYDSSNFVDSLTNGTGLTVAGKIYNADHELLYTSTTSLAQDCYSYTYFYIEAYLEAGKTYYLSSTTSGNEGEYCVRITDSLTLMFDTYVTMPTTVVSTGGEIFPDITVENLTTGEILTLGEDYLLEITENINPGYANVYLYGLGDYYGVSVRTFTITVENAKTTEISPSKTYTFDIAQGEYAAASITFDAQATYRVTFDADTEIKSYLKHISTSLSTQNKKNQFINLMQQGEYILMFYPVDGSAASVSVTIERLYSIADATVYVEDLDYVAGVAQIPDVTVRYGFTTLTEGVDYELSFIGNSPLPGVHYFGIKGLGVYTGTATGSYNVGCSIKTSQAVTISQGEHTAAITEAGSYKLFKFTADADGNYLLSTRETDNVALVVFDSNKNTVAANSAPMGFGAEFTMQNGDVMYIAAMYYDATKVGSFDFEITSDYVLLEDVEAQFEEYVPLGDGKTMPQVTFVDGDYTLQPNVDYEYFYAMNCTNYGDAVICYRGLGRYKFNTYIEYTIVMPIEQLDENAVSLEADKPLLYEGDYYDCGVYSFTATQNAYYNISQLAIIDMAFVQFYDENGKFLSQRSIGGGTDVSTRFFLKENETMYILTGYKNCQNKELYSGYLVKASIQSKVTTETYTENGITYTVFPSQAYAVVSAVDKNIENVEILEYIDVCYAVTQINSDAFSDCTNIQRLVIPSSVVKIGARSFENTVAKKIYLPDSIEIIGYRAFANAQIDKLCIFATDAELITNSILQGCTVYGYENTTAQSYCNANDVEYIILSLMLGDLDNDGEITAIDATISTRIAVGIISADPDMPGDVNGDGLYDSIDATLITRYAVKIIDKFPIQ